VSIDFVLVKRLWIGWFPRLYFCGLSGYLCFTNAIPGFSITHLVIYPRGPSIKYVTLEERGSEKVWQFVTGRVQEHVTSHFWN